MAHHALRLTIDRSALADNWRWLAERAGAACGAAIKADGYGLGARQALEVLAAAGCRDFFVATWAEAEALGPLGEGLSLAVLHGVGRDDLGDALASSARPVLSTAAQVARWREAALTRQCDVMVDTGMNRLGLDAGEIDCLDGLAINTLMSHLACADEDHRLNAVQLERFGQLRASVAASRYSLANSAGICLGRDYSFDLVRPGLALYGGTPRSEARGHIRQVAWPTAQVIQRRTIHAGTSCGYGATFTAQTQVEAAIVNIGYADGYWRGFSSRGGGRVGEVTLPVLGRVSMDLVALDCGGCPGLGEGDWVELDFALEAAAKTSGMSQYELLTGLGRRFERHYR